MLSQSFGDITAGDIQGLCDSSVPEDHLLEFKETLPGDRGRIDPWIDGTGDPTAYAVDRLFREIIGFANYQGGALILGVVETKTKPPRAESIQPLTEIDARKVAADFLLLQVRRLLAEMQCIADECPHCTARRLQSIRMGRLGIWAAHRTSCHHWREVQWWEEGRLRARLLARTASRQ